MYLYVAFLTMHGFIEAFSESCNVIYIMLLCFTIEQVLCITMSLCILLMPRFQEISMEIRSVV